MKELQEVFNNREIALIFWLSIILFFKIASPFSPSFISLIKNFFDKKLLNIYILMIIYVFLLIVILKIINLWNISLLKDTCIWLIVFLFSNFFKTKKIRNNYAFIKIINTVFCLTLFIEFIINFKTFGLLIEFIMLPILTCFGVLKFISEKDNKINFFNFYSKVVSLLGFIYFAFSIYKTIINYEDFISNENLNSLVLTPILSLLSIPFLYLICVYSEYEQLYLRVMFMNRDKKIQLKIKKQIFFDAKFNLNRISFLRDNLLNFNPFEISDLKQMI